MGTPPGKILVWIKRDKARKVPGTQMLNMIFSLHFLFPKPSLLKDGVYRYAADFGTLCRHLDFVRPWTL